MKKTTLFMAMVVLTTFDFNPCKAATTVPGGTVSGHWTLSGSPYNITGSVQIPSDSTLLIDPGVTVSFQTSSHLKMLVNGRILAVGTATQIIHITASDHTVGFGGIRFNTLAASNDTSRFVYCDIQYGMDGIAPYTNGGAIYINNWDKVVILHCTIKNCQATHGDGAAIYCSGSSPVINYNTITYNSGTTVGGVYLLNPPSAMTMTNNTISNNTGCGLYVNNIPFLIVSFSTLNNNTNGGLYISASSNVKVSNNSFYGNTDAGITIAGSTVLSINNNNLASNTGPGAFGGGNGGGGINCLYGSSVNRISDNILSLNISSTGGGISVDGSAIGSIIHNTITGSTGKGILFQNANGAWTCDSIADNSVTSNSGCGGYYGGGICLNGGTLNYLVNNVISGNSSCSIGGGIYINSAQVNNILNNTILNNSSSGGGGGVYVDSYSVLPSISHNIISGNSAGSDGGGLYIQAGNTVSSIDNNLITNNSAGLIASLGGGIYLDGDAGNDVPAFTNNTIANNNASNGGALYCTNTANPTFRNCILRGNTAAAGAQVFLYDEPSDPNFYYCDVQGGSAAIDVNGNFYTGTYTFNTSANPLFVAPSAGSGSTYSGTYNWTLQGTSPCRNTGDPGGSYPATDLYGNPRIAGPNIDMGAYEYEMSVSFTTTSVSCNGAGNGTATAIVVNGSPTYSYTWSTLPVQTTQTATGLSAGTYTVIVTDGLLATATGVVTITQPQALAFIPTITNASCANNDGSLSIIATGGVMPYGYLWSTSSTDSLITGLASGNYTITVTDSNSCILTQTYYVPMDITLAPAAPFICLVSDDSIDASLNQFIDVYWDKTTFGNNIDSVYIYRYTTSSGYVKIGAVSNDTATLSRYTDVARSVDGPHGGDPEYTYYQYKIALHDICGNTSAMSLYHSSINWYYSTYFLWNVYDIEGGPVITGYNLMKDSLNNGNWQLVTSTVGTTANDPNYSASANYRVDGLGFNCTPTRTSISTSHSNIRHQASGTVGYSSIANQQPEIFIYPNPADDRVVIELTTNNQQPTTIRIENTLGQVVFQSALINKQTTIDLSGFAKGVYRVVVDSKNGRTVKKLVVE